MAQSWCLLAPLTPMHPGRSLPKCPLPQRASARAPLAQPVVGASQSRLVPVMSVGACGGVVAAVAAPAASCVQLVRPPARNCRCCCRRGCVAFIVVVVRVGRGFSPPPLQTWLAAAHAWSPRSPVPLGGLPH